MTPSLIVSIIAKYWFNNLEYIKLGLGVYQVIWYRQKSIFGGVKHVLMSIFTPLPDLYCVQDWLECNFECGLPSRGLGTLGLLLCAGPMIMVLYIQWSSFSVSLIYIVFRNFDIQLFYSWILLYFVSYRDNVQFVLFMYMARIDVFVEEVIYTVYRIMYTLLYLLPFYVVGGIRTSSPWIIIDTFVYVKFVWWISNVVILF
jgi:hypothetical protein